MVGPCALLLLEAEPRCLHHGLHQAGAWATCGAHSHVPGMCILKPSLRVWCSGDALRAQPVLSRGGHCRIWPTLPVTLK